MRGNPRSELKVCLAILNYEGREHLAAMLPTVSDAVASYGRPCPVILLDNQSRTDDVAWVRANYPHAETVVAPKNDFLFSYNWLLSQRAEDVVILLNNDLKLSENFISCLLQHFDEPSVFAVSSKAYTWEGDRVNSGPCFFKVRRRGWVVTGFDIRKQVPSYTLFASGGFMAVDRRKFIELGGFDPLFYPAYGEDKDLCFRAWCKGWKSIYEPRCFVFHRESGTWDSGADNRSAALIERTNYLFMWRNLRHTSFRITHAAYLVWLLCRKTVERDARWLGIYREARALWKQCRASALRNAPGRTDLHYLQRICGTQVITES